MIDQLQQKHGKKISRLEQKYDQQIKQLASLVQKTLEQNTILAKQIKVLRIPQAQTVALME